MARPSAEKLHALTALRFFAAAMIVVHHSSVAFPWARTLTGAFHLSQAVSFFFVLSGFILTYVYPALDSWKARLFFWRARLARIWPAHLAAFVLLFVLFKTPAHFGTQYGSVSLGILNLGLMHAWIPVRYVYSSFNYVSWTISTEFAFYLVFPLLVQHWRQTWPMKLMLSLALAVGCVVLAIGMHIPTEDVHDSWRVSLQGVIYMNPLARLFEFTLGMVTARLFERSRDRRRWTFIQATALELAAVALVLVNMYLSPDIARLLVGDSASLEPVRQTLVLGQLSCVSFAVLVYVMARGGGAVSRALGWPVAVFLGEISYSVYLLHILLLTFYLGHVTVTPGWEGLPAFAGFWVVLLVSSWLVWLVVERPMRRWIVKGLGRPQPNVTAEAAIAASGTGGQG